MLGRKRHCSFCFALLDHSSEGRQPAILEGHVNSLWEGSRGEELRPQANRHRVREPLCKGILQPQIDLQVTTASHVYFIRKYSGVYV